MSQGAVRVWVKVCGTTSVEDARLSVAAGAHALGFIFAPSSRRIEIKHAAEIIATLPTEVEKIGVFVNESPALVGQVAEQVRLTGAQLHGDEAAESLAAFRRVLGDRKIIKTVQARQLVKTRNCLAPYLAAAGEGAINAILLDSGSPSQRGGTGVPFDWMEAVSLAAEIQDAVPLIVAGGLTSHNVGDALRLLRPSGVDVVSGVERAPGKKDETRLRDFFEAVRRAQS